MVQREGQAQQERYVGLLQSIVTSLIGQRGPSLKDRVDELVALKALSGDNPKAPVELLKEVLLTGLQLGQGGNAGGGDEGDGGMVRVLDKGLDLIGRALERAPGPRGVPAGAGARPPAGAVVPEHLRPYTWLLKYVPQAIGFAKGGTRADRAAQAVYALVPDEHLDALEDFARMDQAQRAQLLQQLDPRLGPYLTFLDELAAQMVTIFDREAAEDVDEPKDAPRPVESA
jgi:hypothetical protein